jgi:hypothetical protein
MYLAEIAGAQNGVPLPGKDDTGAAICHAAGPSDDVRRRNVIAAAVACGNQPMNGKKEVTALEYVELFLTEPVEGANSDARLLAEIVGTAGGIGSGALEASYRDFIQLYR